MRIEAIHLDQDDPKKCTARKLERAGLIKCKSRISQAPKRGVLLDPLADHILSPADARLVVGGSLVALDCSWKKIEDSVVQAITQKQEQDQVEHPPTVQTAR